MSTIFDAASITVAQMPSTSVGTQIGSITITVPTTPTSVSITAPNTVSSVDVTVPGPQGPPGLQNVYVSEAAPTWGPEQEGFIWAQIL